MLRPSVVHWMLPLVLTLVAADPASTQRSPVARFWYALEAAETTTQVRAASAPGDLDEKLAEHLRALREYELEPRRRAAVQLRWDLRRDLDRNRSSVEHHLAMALMLRRGPDALVQLDDNEANRFIDPRSNASYQALRSLRLVLRSDPRNELAALELARFVLERHDSQLLAEAESALAGVEQSAEVLLYRAGVAVERGDLTAALGHTVTARAAGGDAGRVAHARAIPLLLDPATERMGAAAYIDGLEGASPAAVRDYHAKSAITFTLAEESVWDTLPAGRRAGWLRELWELRALRAGVSLAERLGVHYRRLYEAYRDWPLYHPLMEAGNMAGMGVFIGEDPRRHGVAPQGLALVRFGDAAWFRWVGICGVSSIPYLYQNPESKFSVLDLFLPPRGYRPVDTMDIMLYEDSKRIRSVDCGNPADLRQYAQWIMSGERYRPSYGRALGVQAEIYAFRAPDGTDVVAALTLRSDEVRELRDASGHVTLTAAIALVDTTTRQSTRSERVLQFVPPASAGSHVLLSAAMRTQMIGAVEMRLTLEDSVRRRGAVLGLDRAVPDFTGAELQLSDLVIAPQNHTPTLQRGSVGIGMAAGRKYRRGETFDLYYEIYGLDDDTPYGTRIVVAPQASALWRAVQRLTGTEPDVVAFSFEDNAGATHAVYGVQQLRGVGTSALSPGTYRLLVEVTDLKTGRVARSERLLNVID